MLRTHGLLSEVLARRRAALGPRGAARTAETPAALIWVERLRGSRAARAGEGVEEMVDYKGKAMWDPEMADDMLMPCDAFHAVPRAAFKGAPGAVTGVAVSRELEAEASRLDAEVSLSLPLERERERERDSLGTISITGWSRARLIVFLPYILLLFREPS